MTYQSGFHAGLLNPAAAVPAGMTDGQSRPAGRRYGVYRNNVTVSLREALSQGFPAIVSLIGQDNFDHVARGFLRQSPPSSPLMMQYGDKFPEYLKSVEQLAHLPYLADVARIDYAMRQSYHAADSTGIDPATLEGLDEARLLRTRVSLAPSLRLVRSRWPAGSIRAYALRQGPKPGASAEDVLILRADYDPAAFVIGAGAADVVIALQSGTAFGDAIARGGRDFDLGALLRLLLTQRAIVGLTP